MNDLVIKNIIKQHLKVKVEHQTPHTFNNGYLKVGIYWDNELINESFQKNISIILLNYERVL